MRPLRDRLRETVKTTKSPQNVVELDYALSYVLAGIAAQPSLATALVLKGGTALKKLFFGQYRFSEDLDFTALGGPRGDELKEALREALVQTGRLLAEQGPFTLGLERYLERRPHPAQQEAFLVRVRFPWHPEPLCRVKLEITTDEPLLLGPATRNLIHGYEEELEASLLCYQLEEIVAEKLRALRQSQERLRVRGWHRPRIRDYYDLWRVMGTFGEDLQREGLGDLIQRKCAQRGVSFHSLDDFFPPELVAEARAQWERGLGPYVPVLPDCDGLLEELRGLLLQVLPDLS